MKEYRIIHNRIKCLRCGDIIESTYRHDYIECSCRACAVDGGKDYLRRCGASSDWKEMSEVCAVESNAANMKVLIMSRAEAVFYCYYPHKEDTCMISISDPRMQYRYIPFCTSENRVKSILKLCFADADQPGCDVYGHKTDVDDLMSEADAESIARLIDANQGLPVIVHCDAGVSRSAGVAAAILKFYTGDDSYVFENPRFQPNMWCYRKTLCALMKHKNAEH